MNPAIWSGPWFNLLFSAYGPPGETWEVDEAGGLVRVRWTVRRLWPLTWLVRLHRRRWLVSLLENYRPAGVRLEVTVTCQPRRRSSL